MEIQTLLRVQAGDLAAATSEALVHLDRGFLCGRGSGISWCKVRKGNYFYSVVIDPGYEELSG